MNLGGDRLRTPPRLLFHGPFSLFFSWRRTMNGSDCLPFSFPGARGLPCATSPLRLKPLCWEEALPQWLVQFGLSGSLGTEAFPGVWDFQCQTQRVWKGRPPDGRLCWASKAFIGGWGEDRLINRQLEQSG